MPVDERRFVPVMAVGNDEGFVLHVHGQRLNDGRVGYGPEPVADIAVVHEIVNGRCEGRFHEDTVNRAFGF